MYTLTESHKINSSENGLKEPIDINFSVASKREWNKIPANQQKFGTNR